MQRARDGEATGYRLMLPCEWARVDLEPAGREASVAALVDHQFTGLGKDSSLRTQTKRGLLAKAAATHAAGGIEMFLSMQRIAGVPIAASLATFLIPPDGDNAVDAAGLARCVAGDDRDVALIDLPVGPAVRVRRYSGRRNAPESMVQEVFVPVPGSDWWLLLTFAAPFGPLARALTKLFDAICATLRWD